MPQLLRYLNSLDNVYIVPLVHIIVIVVLAYLILRLVDSGLRRLRSVIHAEDFPEKPLIKLRMRIIEKYSRWRVAGPVYWLEKK